MLKNLSPFEVKNIIDNEKDYKLIDVREVWEYEYAKIEGAENIPLILFEQAAVNLDKNQKLILYCHHGSRSYRACSFLVQDGYNDVINLDGGIDAWSAMIDPSINRY